MRGVLAVVVKRVDLLKILVFIFIRLEFIFGVLFSDVVNAKTFQIFNKQMNKLHTLLCLSKSVFMSMKLRKKCAELHSNFAFFLD